MKKNKTMRAASALLVVALLSTSIISGTFAKYTTGASAQDSARVAKWGVTVTATGDEAFAEKYNDEANVAGVKVVSSEEGKKVVAPGTKGTLLTYNIQGTPEVQTKVDATATLTLNNWTINTSETYCPLVFKVTAGETTVTYKLGATESDGTTEKVYTSIATLKTALEKAITSDLSKQTVNANTSLADSITVSWEWPYNETDTAGAYQTDAKDTALGDLTGDSVPTIKMESSVTVTQID